MVAAPKGGDGRIGGPVANGSVVAVPPRLELKQLIRAVPLFAGLLPSEVDRIALVMRPRDVGAGVVICAEGEPGHEFFVLARGEAGIERGDETIAKLHVGDHFGELALLDRGPRSATVRALGDCRLYVLEDAAFAAVLNEVPALAQKLLATLAGRLREAETPPQGEKR
ncbi:MAG TPA: cyclic nucleotide-binding domain-containing protein [Nocardioidaceae bacterium]